MHQVRCWQLGAVQPRLCGLAPCVWRSPALTACCAAACLLPSAARHRRSSAPAPTCPAPQIKQQQLPQRVHKALSEIQPGSPPEVGWPALPAAACPMLLLLRHARHTQPLPRCACRTRQADAERPCSLPSHSACFSRPSSACLPMRGRAGSPPAPLCPRAPAASQQTRRPRRRPRRPRPGSPRARPPALWQARPPPQPPARKLLRWQQARRRPLGLRRQRRPLQQPTATQSPMGRQCLCRRPAAPPCRLLQQRERAPRQPQQWPLSFRRRSRLPAAAQRLRRRRQQASAAQQPRQPRSRNQQHVRPQQCQPSRGRKQRRPQQRPQQHRSPPPPPGTSVRQRRPTRPSRRSRRARCCRLRRGPPRHPCSRRRRCWQCRLT